MNGAIAYAHGVLYVGRSAKTATVEAFDEGGRPLAARFTFRDADVGRSSVAGLDVDADHRVWVADEAAGKLRAFTLFGRSVATLGGTAEDLLDVRGALGAPVAVRARGSDERLVLLIASGGRRRYALQLHRPHDARTRVLRSLGEAEGTFDDLADVHWSTARGPGPDLHTAEREFDLDDGADWIVTTERRARRLLVFRGGRFVHAVALAGMPAAPEAAVRLPDGRFVVAFGAANGVSNGNPNGNPNDGGALILLGRDGRRLAALAGPDEVDHPSGLALLPGATDAETRLWVVDREGTRVQLFTVDGRGWGEFTSLAAR